MHKIEKEFREENLLVEVKRMQEAEAVVKETRPLIDE
jgi:hypothetical protein